MGTRQCIGLCLWHMSHSVGWLAYLFLSEEYVSLHERTLLWGVGFYLCSIKLLLIETHEGTTVGSGWSVDIATA